MKENVLITLSKQFAVDIVNLCTEIKEHRKSNVLLNQLLRSGTSIGANIHEANYASSKADFINKFQIALKECYETDYWLGLFKDTNMITAAEYNEMFAQCSKIRRLLIASITTAKNNKEETRCRCSSIRWNLRRNVWKNIYQTTMATALPFLKITTKSGVKSGVHATLCAMP